MCDYMANVRLPSVQDSLWVVLANPRDHSKALSEPDICELEALPAPREASASARSQPLNVGPAEVVAIYSLIPPSAPTTQRQGLPSNTILRVRHKLTAWIRRLAWMLPLVRYGLLVPLRASWWMSHLIEAVEIGERLPLCKPEFHDLQTMCVARHLQGQGMGSAVMAMVQEQARDIPGFQGMKGLCQSEATRRFYEKQGFQTVPVLSHAYGWRGTGSLRTHWLVAWSLAVEKAGQRGDGLSAASLGCSGL